MTPEERAELRNLAQAAQGERWELEPYEHFVVGSDPPDTYWDVDGPNGGWVAHVGEKTDAAFIAAANPATVLALLDRIDELEAGQTRTEWGCAYGPDDEPYAATTERIARHHHAIADGKVSTLTGRPFNPRIMRRTVTTSAWEAVE